MTEYKITKKVLNMLKKRGHLMCKACETEFKIGDWVRSYYARNGVRIYHRRCDEGRRI